MAQKREKEETELKVPETLSICSPPISSPPPPLSLPDDSSARSPHEGSDPKLSGAADRNSRSRSPSESSDLRIAGAVDLKRRSARSPERSDLSSFRSQAESLDPKLPGAIGQKSRSARLPSERREVIRCSGCRRKVGLMGFRCRCGELFCSEHRYSDRHECSFDYKAAGREAIARENPMVRAPKILKV